MARRKRKSARLGVAPHKVDQGRFRKGKVQINVSVHRGAGKYLAEACIGDKGVNDRAAAKSGGGPRRVRCYFTPERALARTPTEAVAQALNVLVQDLAKDTGPAKRSRSRR